MALVPKKSMARWSGKANPLRVSFVVILAFAACGARAGNLDCQALAKEHKLSGENKQAFLKECLRDQAQDEKITAVVPAPRSPTKGDRAAPVCMDLNRCGDLSLHLEATAAGLGAGARSNSGHSFVRVRRVSE